MHPIFDSSTKPNRKIEVPIELHPTSMLFPLLGAPRIFNPVPVDPQHDNTWHRSDMSAARSFVQQHGISKFATGSLDTWAMCRVLAKIAHAYTVSVLGLDGFVPLLPHFIMGNGDGARFFYVGSSLTVDPPNPDALHEVGFEEPATEQWQLWVVRIRLFAQFGAPTYRVVSGFRLAPAKPLEVLLAEADALRNPLGMFARYRADPPMPSGLWDRDAPSSNAIPAQGPDRYLRAQISLNEKK